MNDSILLSIIDNIYKTKGHYPGKKELQKTIYLLQNKGLDLKYKYRFYFYGPYSDALDEDIHKLAIRGALIIEHEEMTHRIKVNRELSQGIPQTNSLVESTLDELQSYTPTQLELMTTILFLINNNMLPTGFSIDDVVAKVMEVKAKKYSEEMIKQYYNILVNQHYIRQVA